MGKLKLLPVPSYLTILDLKTRLSRSLRSTSRLSLHLAAALVAAGLATPAFGANRTWSGTASDNASLATNWGGTAPVSGADWLSFTNDPTNKAPTFATNFTAVGSVPGTPIISFSNTAGNFTLGGPGVITIDAKNTNAGFGYTFIQSASAATQTINNNLVLINTGNNTTQFNSIRSFLGTLNLGNVTDNTGKLQLLATNAAAKINIVSISAAGLLVAGGNQGTVTITDARSITGLFQVQAGTVVLGSSLAAGTNNSIALSVNSSNSTTLKILDGVNFSNNILNNPTSGATTQTLGLDSGTATFSGTVAANSAFTTSTILNAGTGATLNMAGVISGVRPITKDGAGTVTLSAANTYTGLTTVSAGTLAYATNNAISNGAVTVNGAGATLAMGAFNDSVGAVTLTAGDITGTGILTSTGGFTMNNADATSVSAILAGSVALTKSAAGTLTLSAANTFSGTTRITAGTILLGNTLALQNSTVDMTTGDTGLVSFGPSLTAATLGALTGSRDLSLLNTSGTPAAVTLSVGNASATSYIYTGVLSGGNLYKIGAGAGTFTLNPGTGISVSLNSLSANAGGAMILKSGNITTTGIDPGQATFWMGAGARGGTLTVDGADLTVGGVGTRRFVIGAAASGTGNLISGSITAPEVYIGHNGTATMNQSGGTLTTTLLQHVDGGTATYAMTGGTLTVRTIQNFTASANAFTFSMNGGTVRAAADTGTNNLFANNAKGGAEVTVQLGSTGATIDTSQSSARIVRPLDNMPGQAGTLTKIGTNTLTLLGNNTYTGGTTVSGGTLELGDGGSVLGNITNNAAFSVNRTNSSTLGNAISGTGALTKSGVGLLTLSGNNTYTGLTTVSNGTLVVSNSILSASINSNSVSVDFASAPTNGTYVVLRGPVATNSLVTTSVSGLIGKNATVANSPNLVVQVTDRAAGPTFEDAYRGIDPLAINPANGLAYLMNYALGGTGPSSTPALPVLTSDGTSLTLTANIRDTGQGVNVVAEYTYDLAGEWRTDQVSITPGETVVANTKLTSFSIQVESGRPKKFMRLKAIKQ